MKIFWVCVLEKTEKMNEEGYLEKMCMKIGVGVLMMLYIAKRVNKGQAQRANSMVKYKDCRKGCG